MRAALTARRPGDERDLAFDSPNHDYLALFLPPPEGAAAADTLTDFMPNRCYADWMIGTACKANVCFVERDLAATDLVG